LTERWEGRFKGRGGYGLKGGWLGGGGLKDIGGGGFKGTGGGWVERDG
jgi:hypothetical protein